MLTDHIVEVLARFRRILGKNQASGFRGKYLGVSK